jgi:NTP pyrophosphatase (non-canonical NTP hydrolase)
MKESEELIQALLKFRNERDWEQFHNAKDLAIALNVEAGELLELFLWKNADEANKEKVRNYRQEHREEINERRRKDYQKKKLK